MGVHVENINIYKTSKGTPAHDYGDAIVLDMKERLHDCFLNLHDNRIYDDLQNITINELACSLVINDRDLTGQILSLLEGRSINKAEDHEVSNLAWTIGMNCRM